MTQLEIAREEIALQIGLEKDRYIKKPWTPDYKEGYVDGLSRANELIEELIGTK